jgi:CheY-like chemotaxis protein
MSANARHFYLSPLGARCEISNHNDNSQLFLESFKFCTPFRLIYLIKIPADRDSSFGLCQFCGNKIIFRDGNATLRRGFSFEVLSMRAIKGKPSMKVLIASDVRLHREGVAGLLERVLTVSVIGAVDVNSLLHTPSRRMAAVLLLDLVPRDNPKIVSFLRRSLRRIRIVAIGVREEESEVLACAAAGVDGYVRVDAAPQDLVAVLESVMRRELVCSPKVAASLYNCVG